MEEVYLERPETFRAAKNEVFLKELMIFIHIFFRERLDKKKTIVTYMI